VVYERGDYVKVEYPDETTGIGEWMWVRVHHCDDEKQLVFGVLDNEPVNDYDGKIEPGSELAVGYSRGVIHRIRIFPFPAVNTICLLLPPRGVRRQPAKPSVRISDRDLPCLTLR